MPSNTIRFASGYPADAEESLFMDEALLRDGLTSCSTRINDPCVSVGFNQNAEAEVDVDLAAALGIPIVRRHTGGGAVFRDRGCVAYSFVLPLTQRELPERTIIGALETMGVHVERTGRNDLYWNGRKVSGCAWLQDGDTILIHGSLLFSTDLELMARLLDCGKSKYRGTAIASVVSRVTNLSEAFPGMDAEGFERVLREHIAFQLEKSGYRPTPYLVRTPYGDSEDNESIADKRMMSHGKG